MDVKVVLSYLLSLGGAGLVGYAVMLAGAINCDYPQARFRIINALRTQPWQAEMMTKTKPGSFFDGIHAAMKAAGQLGLRDPAILQKATIPSYDGAVSLIPMGWKGIFGKLKLGAGLAAGGLVMAIAASALPVLHIILLLGVIGAAAWLFITRRDCERYVVLARLEILPEVESCIAAGRYGVPPVV
jgi:hypothetical protein